MERVHRGSTLVLSGATALLGVAIVVLTLARGDSPASARFVIGAAFVAIGAARVFFASGRGRQRARP